MSPKPLIEASAALKRVGQELLRATPDEGKRQNPLWGRHAVTKLVEAQDGRMPPPAKTRGRDQ